MSFSVAVPVSTHCEDVTLRVHRRRRQPVPATYSIRPPLAAARTAMLGAREQNTRESYLRGIEAGTRGGRAARRLLPRIDGVPGAGTLFADLEHVSKPVPANRYAIRDGAEAH